ncbi:hypothetical protein [Hoeflea sp.]|uniref:hypothetical protein n=1 Tax=Hoeflea sp. TaxID=1940281 RepID=UPI0019985C95|nr:hypothetical protein [Hoeflea sp.]MBC7282299.1 hypothetical protein [Hoeflea sp.]
MNIHSLGLPVAAALVWAGAAAAQSTPDTYTDRYCTLVSDADKISSTGTRLTDAASILRQDRANFHRFGKADPDDLGDASFATAEARARMPAMIDKGKLDPAVAREINQGNPVICTDIFTHSMVVGISNAEALDPTPPVFAFAGQWKCGAETFQITPEIFNDGARDRPIIELQEGTDYSYTLFLTDEAYITVSDMQQDSLTWFSSETKQTLGCQRIK